MSYLLIDDPKLIHFLTSNPKEDPKWGAMPVKRKSWTLPAWWVLVPNDTRDEALRPLPAPRSLKQRLVEAARKPAPYSPPDRYPMIKKPPPRENA